MCSGLQIWRLLRYLLHTEDTEGTEDTRDTEDTENIENTKDIDNSRTIIKSICVSMYSVSYRLG